MSEVQILSPRPNRTSCVPAALQAQPLFIAPPDKPTSQFRLSTYRRLIGVALFFEAPDDPSIGYSFSDLAVRTGGSSGSVISIFLRQAPLNDAGDRSLHAGLRPTFQLDFHMPSIGKSLF